MNLLINSYCLRKISLCDAVCIKESYVNLNKKILTIYAVVLSNTGE